MRTRGRHARTCMHRPTCEKDRSNRCAEPTCPYSTGSRRRCGRGGPGPGADVGGVSPVPAQCTLHAEKMVCRVHVVRALLAAPCTAARPVLHVTRRAARSCVFARACGGVCVHACVLMRVCLCCVCARCSARACVRARARLPVPNPRFRRRKRAQVIPSVVEAQRGDRQHMACSSHLASAHSRLRPCRIRPVPTYANPHLGLLRARRSCLPGFATWRPSEGHTRPRCLPKGKPAIGNAAALQACALHAMCRMQR
jgi:hypothetical protein